MTEERIRPRSYLKLLVLTVLLGLISAVMTFVFVVLVDAGQELVWEDAATISGIVGRTCLPGIRHTVERISSVMDLIA
jgi:hypothetical protein